MGKIAWLMFGRTDQPIYQKSGQTKIVGKLALILDFLCILPPIVGAVSIVDGTIFVFTQVNHTSGIKQHPLHGCRWRFASPGKMNHRPGRGKFGAGSGYWFFQRRQAFPIIGLNTGMMEGLHQDRTE